MADFTQTMNNNNRPTPVIDVDSNRVLNDIYRFLNSQQSAQRNTSRAHRNAVDAINNLADQQAQQHSHDVVQSMAAERRDRAVNNALLGDINRTNRAVDDFKSAVEDGLKKLVGMIGDMAKKTIESYDNTARELRKMQISTAEMSKISLKSSKATVRLSEIGLNMNDSETKEFAVELKKNNVQVASMHEDTLAASAALAKYLSLDSKAALDIARSFGDNVLEDVKEVINKGGNNTTGKELVRELFKNKEMQDMLNHIASTNYNNDTTAAFISIQKDMQLLDKTIGNYVSAEELAKASTTLYNISANRFADVNDQDTLKTVFALSADGKLTVDAFNKGIKKLIEEKPSNFESIRNVLSKAGVSQEILHGISVAIKDTNYATKDDVIEGLDAFNQSAEGGKIASYIGLLGAKFDDFTGGIFSSTASKLNEWFGESLGLSTIVVGGFATLAALLKMILVKVSLNSLGGNGVLGGIGKGVGSLAGGLTKFLKILGPIGIAVGAIAGTVKVASILSKDYKNVGDTLELPPATVRKAFEDRRTRDKIADATSAGFKTAAITGGAVIGTAIGGPIGTAAGGIIGGIVGEAVEEVIRSRTHYTNVKEAKQAKKDIEEGIARKQDLSDYYKSEAAKYKGIDDSKYNEYTEISKEFDNEIGSMQKDLVKVKQEYLNLLIDDDEDKKALVDALKSDDSELEKSMNTLKDTKQRLLDNAHLNESSNKSDKDLYNKFKNDFLDAQREHMQNFMGQVYKFKGEDQGEAFKLSFEELVTEYNKAYSGMSEYIKDNNLEELVEAYKDSTGDYGTIRNYISLDSNPAFRNVIGEAIAKEQIDKADRIKAENDKYKSDHPIETFAATGGVFSKPTNSLIGEDGKEAVLPLTKPYYLKKVLSALSPTEQSNIIKAILGDSNSNVISSAFSNSLSSFSGSSIQSDTSGNSVLSDMYDEYVTSNSTMSDISNSSSSILEIINKYVLKSARFDDKVDSSLELLSSYAQLMINEHAALSSIMPFANGGIVSSPTKAVIGEDGKEAILPLSKPGELSKTLKSLSPVEKRSILQSIYRDKITTKEGIISALMNILNRRFIVSNKSDESDIISSVATGNYDDEIKSVLSNSTIRKKTDYEKQHIIDMLTQNKKYRKRAYTESIANSSKRVDNDSIIAGTPAEDMLNWGFTRLGAPYILESLGKVGYVCNEFVNAALSNSGIRTGLTVHSVRRTYKNIDDKKGKYNLENAILHKDLDPSQALPGMIFFTGFKDRNFGTEESPKIFNTPGHTGLVYYGNQLIHASGGTSSKYEKPTFFDGYYTGSKGVAITPFKKGAKYSFLEFPDMYKTKEGEQRLSSDINNKSVEADLSKKLNPDNGVENEIKSSDDIVAKNETLTEQKRLAKEAIDSVVAQTSGDARQAALQYAQQAYTLLNNGNTNDIVASLSSIIKYLRDIANSSANKRLFSSATRPANASFNI